MKKKKQQAPQVGDYVKVQHSPEYPNVRSFIAKIVSISAKPPLFDNWRNAIYMVKDITSDLSGSYYGHSLLPITSDDAALYVLGQ